MAATAETITCARELPGGRGALLRGGDGGVLGPFAKHSAKPPYDP